MAVVSNRGPTLHQWSPLRALVLALVVGVSGCGSVGAYVWVDEAPDALFRSAPGLFIRSGDMVSIKVFGQEPLSVRMKVRSDGVVTMPLIGNVVVAGKDTEAVAKEVAQRFQPFVTAANVVVVDEESNVHIVALGELRRTGTILLENGDTRLSTAIGNAGGLTEFASESQIFVLRSDSTGTYRIRFQYQDIIRGVGRAAIFRLHEGDQIVAE